MKTAAKKRYSEYAGRAYWECLHDPTLSNPPPCDFFEPLPTGHPFAGFCRFNMSKADSASPDDFGDNCHSANAVAAIQEEAAT